MPLIYKHDYHPLSIYGNIVSLLREHVSCSGVHLDIGCGYGAIAEPIRDELGLTYIGFDLADDGMASLRERGFETHRIDLADIARCESVVTEAIGNRPIASLSFMDTLELTSAPMARRCWWRCAAWRRRRTRRWRSGRPGPMSRTSDQALKLLLGRWDVTEDGLLTDHTHVTLYNHSRPTQLMQSVGWRKLATRDWPLNYSDQYFPASSPVLNAASPIGQFLARLIDRANPHAVVNQFVGIYRPGEPQPRPLLDDRVEPNAPFLSVVITAADPGAARLRKLLRELTNQTSHDFELVLLHSAADPEEAIQTGLLKGLPILQGRTRLVDSSGLSRAEALNAALERCSGRYFAILDDAEGLDRDWIATLFSLSEQMPGSVLQVTQSPPSEPSEPTDADARSDAAEALLPAFYRFARREHGCFASLAIPTNAFHQLGFRFELELPDGRGWDLAVDAILHCGLNVSAAPAIAPLKNGALPPLTTDLLGTDRSLSLLQEAQRPSDLAADRRRGAHRGSDRYRLQADPRDRPRAPTICPRLRERIRSASKLCPRSGEGAVGQTRFSSGADRLKDRSLLAWLVGTFWPQWADSETPAEPNAPFLSVITRTQGKRPYTLRDTLMSLAGQSSQDFEVILVVHSDSETVNSAVRGIVNEFPPSFSARIQCRHLQLARSLLLAAQLTASLRLARAARTSRCSTIDDIALGHWVETFERLAVDAPNGALLRATCTRQGFRC